MCRKNDKSGSGVKYLRSHILTVQSTEQDANVPLDPDVKAYC